MVDKQLEDISNHLATKGLICHAWKTEDGKAESLWCYPDYPTLKKTGIQWVEITKGKTPTSSGFAVKIAGDINKEKMFKIRDYLETEFWNKEKEVNVKFFDLMESYIETEPDKLSVALEDIMKIMEGKIYVI